MARHPRSRAQGRTRPRTAKPSKAAHRTLTIDRLGGAGDGLAGEIAIPFTLPGETIEAKVSGRKGTLAAITAQSPARAVPPCVHFGRPGDGCGGCKLQHLAQDDYRAWKTARLTDALARAGVEAPPPRAVWCAPATRRRAKLAFVPHGEGLAAGFRALGSDQVIPLAECHVLDPALFALGQALAPLIGLLPARRPVDVLVTLTDTGADVDVPGADEAALDMDARVLAARLTDSLDLARLSLGGVPLAERRAPSLALGGVPVALPPGAFLQASEAGQAALTQIVLDATKGAGTVADLFCGIGTFALPLSKQARVVAAESDERAVHALSRAAKRAGRPVEAERRDLFTRPLMRDELARLDAVVLDPPRAGARAQAEALARDPVPRVTYVSCDPGTLARDARVLSAAYDLTSLSLVDQFVWSPHIEAVAVFTRRS